MTEVVISGVALRLPQSDNIAEFRDHLMNKDDMITDHYRLFEPGNITRILHALALNETRNLW